MDMKSSEPTSSTMPSTILTTVSTTEEATFSYGHYISHYGHYSYILLILMGLTVLLGSLLIAYVKKLDSGIARRRRAIRHRRLHICSHINLDEEVGSECTLCKTEDLAKDSPPIYQIALTMPKPDKDELKSCDNNVPVDSCSSVAESEGLAASSPLLKPNRECVYNLESEEVKVMKDDIHPSVPQDSTIDTEELPSYTEYINSLGDLNDNTCSADANV